MTLSDRARTKNALLAMTLLLEELEDEAIDQRLFASDNTKFAEIAPTTWKELISAELISPVTVGVSTYYRFTPEGWFEALARTDRLGCEEVRERMARLNATLKSFVDERHADVPVAFDRVVNESNVPAGWVFNAIDCRLVNRATRRRDATWLEGGRGRVVIVPLDFGLTALDLFADLRVENEKLREELEGLNEELAPFKCPHCGAPLVTSMEVPVTNDDWDHVDEFACGYSVGAGGGSPCPSAPTFPAFDEYEIITNERQGFWTALARPKTRNAERLRLAFGGAGRKEDAIAQVKADYERHAKKY